jgi:GxxExxY protein
VKTIEPQINAEERRYAHSDLTEQIIAVFYEVYNELGYGFLESVYEEAMYRALSSRGLEVHRQVPVPVWFRGERIGDFKADLAISNSVLVELKAARTFEPAHEAQLLITSAPLQSKWDFCSTLVPDRK